ncbi:Arm DNA-binding domain-containing protein [Vibrio aerogenes]|uniref:Arm DNA-binding domain-containing protein n=1 Tax=Vibrio aerogenes TaxID=92172 RepID=UPI0009FF98B0|nr:Arm DNA-binding domain-containing protein [Vibrio aerogenes]
MNKLNEYRGPSELNDEEGLIAKISPKANITFQYRCRFNGKNKRFRIGKYPAITLKKARQIHQQILAVREEGHALYIKFFRNIRTGTNPLFSRHRKVLQARS